MCDDGQSKCGLFSAISSCARQGQRAVPGRRPHSCHGFILPARWRDGRPACPRSAQGCWCVRHGLCPDPRLRQLRCALLLAPRTAVLGAAFLALEPPALRRAGTGGSVPSATQPGRSRGLWVQEERPSSLPGGRTNLEHDLLFRTCWSK